MLGLIRNNFYMALASAKWFFVLAILGGMAVAAFGRDAQLIMYGLLCIVGFSVNAVASYRKENASKWSKYKLTAPVRRKQIVKSQFVSHLIWILSGTMIVGGCILLSTLLHGFLFDVATDVASIFVMGIGVSFLLGGLYFPLSYIGGDEKNEFILGISIVGAFGIFAGLVHLANLALAVGVMARMVVVLIVCGLLFLLSYFIAAGIFQKKEF